MDSYNSPSTKPIYHGTRIIWYVVGLIDVLLAFRFFLKLFGANATAGFTTLVYSVTKPLAAPFLNVFRQGRLENNVFEWTTLLAIFVYWLIGWGIIRLFLMGKTVSTPEAARKLNDQEKSE
ncbi:MAG: YggT family protein [bacterium]|nr:YggT family protein [bacterium]